MPKPAPQTKRFVGHVETAFMVGCFSLVFGLMWAVALVVKHVEYELYVKVLIFLASPFVGLLLLTVMGAIVFVFGSAGDWMSEHIAKRRSGKE